MPAGDEKCTVTGETGGEDAIGGSLLGSVLQGGFKVILSGTSRS
jgi:hypothetical protein